MSLSEQAERKPALSVLRRQPVTRVEHTVHNFYAAALACNAAVALWRQPASGQIGAVAALDRVNELAHIDFQRRRSGFVLAPFVNGPQNSALRIDADVLFTPSGIVLPTHGGSERRRQRQARFAAAYAAVRDGTQKHRPRWYLADDSQRDHTASEAEFTGLVRNAVAFIRETGIAKIVVSRTAERTLPPGFDAVDAFLELSVRYPHAFVSLVGIPNTGTWLGASPEILLTLDAQALTTMALAGTQRRPEECPLEEIRWGRKERVEQEMVSDYVRDFFRRAGVAAVEEQGPQTVAAGNVVHLQTLFRVQLPEPERLALANRVLDKLHPTSAVCGMPKHKALAFILANEQYARSFYSGFLGPVHVEGQSSLYVNLRCMQLHQESASLYVGAGITADSEPAAEWRETEMKAETVLAVLGPAQ